MKILNGKELADYIKQNQVQQVRGIVSGQGIQPKLAIVQIKDDPIIDTYIRLKKRYGADIGIEVESHHPKQSDAIEVIKTLNTDSSVHGIIVQLPIEDTSQTDEIVNAVTHNKDVDALGENPDFDPATPTAIMWLLAGYNVDLKEKNVLLIGKGKLVGAPLEKMLKESGISVTVADRATTDLSVQTLAADIIVTATGSPALLYSNMIKDGAVVVDAGVASEDGKKVGDVAPELFERDDLTITPEKGGVGPLTVCALFDNVIRAARQTSRN